VNARTLTAGTLGIEGFVITIDAAPTSSSAAEGLRVAGLDGRGDDLLKSILTALRSIGHRPPPMAITLSHAPSPGHELAVALAILVALEVIPATRLEGVLCWGALDLDGRIRRANGMLVAVDTARASGISRVIVPTEDARLAAKLGVEVTAADTLTNLVAFLRGEAPVLGWGQHRIDDGAELERRGLDMADIRGLARPKLALEVALAGGHHMLMRGPTGVGKTMLARRVGGLLPDLEPALALDVSKIFGLSHAAVGADLKHRPPVRMPHHTCSVAGLLGGGPRPRPGEVSLAHGGVLFLDELPEFALACIEGVRAAMADGVATAVGSGGLVRYPAKIQLLASMARCSCGYLGDPRRACTCSEAIVERFLSRIKPIASRFDIAVDVEPQTPEDLTNSEPAESSAAIRVRICKARVRQAKRWADAPWRLNSEIPDAAVLQLEVTGEAVAVLRGMLHTLDLDGRLANRVMRIARTVQDLGGSYGAITGDSIMTAGMLASLR
jgi:magnesium chelatase family protein